MKARVKGLLCQAAWIFALGAVLLFLSACGFGIPCVFHLITGWQCPGCGATRMLLSLLRRDWKGAFHYNPALMVLLPMLALWAVPLLRQYLLEGTWHTSKKQNRMLWGMTTAFLLFGILRNI